MIKTKSIGLLRRLRLITLIIMFLPVFPIKRNDETGYFLKKYYKFIDNTRIKLNSLYKEDRDAIARKYFIPMVNNLFNKNCVNAAQYTLLALEEWFLSYDTDEKLNAVMSLFSNSAIQAGLRFRAKFPLKKVNLSSKDKPVISFTSYYTAKEGFEVILGLGKYLTELPIKIVALKAFSYREGRSLNSICEEVGYELKTSFTSKRGNYKNKYNVFDFRDVHEKAQTDIAIWVTPPFHMFFFFSFGIAPKQLWFTNYLRPNLEFKYLDGKFALGGDGVIAQREFSNVTWDIIAHVTYIDKEEIKEETENKVILFSPARLEKLKQKTYLEALIAIMKKCPNTIYKWTGYYKDQELVNLFKENGLSERHQYIPWLDNNDLLNEIEKSDIILSTFPLALGTTEMMASTYKKPIIAMYDKECSQYWRDPFWCAEQGNIELQKICLNEDGNSILRINKTVEDYIDDAVNVINNKELAEKYADVYYKAYDYTYLNNKNDIQKQFINIINKSL